MSASFQALEKKLQRTAERVLFLLKKKGTLDVICLSNNTMRMLNKTARGKNEATNVLSFPFPTQFPLPDVQEKYLGEVYLAPDYITSKHEDIEHLLIHGILHLLGFRHERRDDRIVMEKFEKRLRAALASPKKHGKKLYPRT